MKDIILISPVPEVHKGLVGGIQMYASPPLGLAYIAAVLREIGYHVDIIDMGPQQLKVNDVIERIAKEGCPVVGITSIIGLHGNAMRLAAKIKQEMPEIKIIMGGPLASFISQEILESGYVDVVCLFEGEETIKEVMAYYHGEIKDLSSIAGIAYKENGKIRTNPMRPFIQDLDRIPFPARDLFNLKKYIQRGVVITGRGCPYRCIFCSANTLSGKQYRMRSAGNVVDELEMLVDKYDLGEEKNMVLIADDTFTANKGHCINICREIRKRKLDIVYDAECRANTITDEIAKEMAISGCRHVQIGVESGNDLVLKKIKKGITTQQVRESIRILLKNGITAVCSFIIGLPFDTIETVHQTIDFAKELCIMGDYNVHVKFSILTPLPGTYLYEHRDELGIKLLTDRWDLYSFSNPVMETKYLSKENQQSLYMQAWKEISNAQSLQEKDDLV